MAVFDVTEAVSYLGRTVLVELVFDDERPESEPTRCVVRIAGVVLALEGVYDWPHFLVFDAVCPGVHPEEVFWSDIQSIRPLVEIAV